MIKLSENQEHDLEGAVATLFTCYKEVYYQEQPSRARIAAEQGRGDTAYLLCWDDFPNSILRLLSLAIDRFFSEMMPDNLDRYNALAGGEDKVCGAMRSFLTAPGEVGWTLATLLAWEAGHPTAALKHVIDAGLALEELREHDQNYGIVAPGIVSLHNLWKDQHHGMRAVGVVDTLKDTLARAFALQ
jgi:hypothetical protein